jgi:capsular exopolysaccharide synthesis family protein
MALKFKGSERSLGQILGIFWRYKLVLAGAMVLFAIVGYAIVRQIAPTFTADASLMIQTQQLSLPDVNQFTNPFAVTPGDPSAVMRSEIAVIRSRPIIETVIMELGLTRDPEVNPYLRPPGGLGHFIASLRTTLPAGIVDTLDGIGVHLPTPLARDPTNEEITDASVRGVLARLDVGNDGRSFIITLGYHSENPLTAARILNSVMDSYITAQIAAKLQATADANAWLNERITQLRREVEAADQAVQAFRLRYGLVDTRMGTVTQQQVAEINTQLVMAEAEAATAEATLRSAGNGAAARATVESPLISRLREREAEAQARLSDITTRFGPSHPQRQVIENEMRDLRAQIATETERIRQSLANQATAAQSRVGALRAQLRTLQGSATRNAEAEAQLAQLQREADGRRQIYQRLQETAQQTAGAPRSNQADARIITAAVAPTSPTGPRTTLLTAGAGLVGMLLAAALALVLAELDRGFERTDELEAASGMATLGALPLVRWKRSTKSLVDFVIHNPASAAAETIRGFVEALRRADGDEAPKVILVTSSLAGEGKTSLAAAMGRLLAKDGRKVLLIEADFRRPQIGAFFDQPAPTTDFEDVLEGKGQWRDALQTDAQSGLAYLSAAAATDSPQALLASSAWNTIIAEARSSYDLIVIDTPPVMSVIDTVILARHADTTMLVVGWRSTQRRIVQETLKRLKRVGRPIAGLVLSKVQGQIEVAEYYAGYYGPGGKPTRGRRRSRDAAAEPATEHAAPRPQLEPRSASEALNAER